MKDLEIINGNPRYLHCSMMGTYYIPCTIIKKNKHSVRIEYEDDYSGELVQKTIPNREVEYICRFWDGENDEEDIQDFLIRVKENKIPLDKAMKIIQGSGEIIEQ